MLNVIYDNIIFNLQTSGGISVYWSELIKRMVADTSIKAKFIEYRESSRNIFRNQLNIRDKDIILYNAFLNLNITRYINLQHQLNEKTVFHSSYYRTMNNKLAINVVTVHDFIYEKKIKKMVGKLHIHQKRKALGSADGIICISENTKKDMLELYPELESKTIKVIHNGYNPHDYYFAPEITLENRVVFVGARTGYKNFNRAIEIVAGIDNVFLDIVGTPLNNNESDLLERTLNSRYTVHEHINNKVLNDIYNKSICLIYLSEYEGFGIPILEAMSAGCPVIALSTSSIPEVAGKAGLLFDRIDYNSIRKIIIKLRDNNEYRKYNVDLGIVNSKKFSWDKCYSEVLNFYQYLSE